jgi:hypothetical protein
MSKLKDVTVKGITDLYKVREQQQAEIADKVKLSRKLFGEQIQTMRYTHPDWSESQIKRYIRKQIKINNDNRYMVDHVPPLKATYPRMDGTSQCVGTHHTLYWLDGILFGCLCDIEDGWTDLLSISREV